MLTPFAPENLVSRDGFGSPIPRGPAHLHTQAESGAYLRDSSRVPRRRLRHGVSQSLELVYRVRTYGVHCRESAGTGSVVFKVVRLTINSAALAGHHGPINVQLCFPHPLLV